jgi:hypothetical protein
MRAETDNRCLDFSNIEVNTVAGDDLASREFVANKEMLGAFAALFCASSLTGLTVPQQAKP